MESHGHWNTPEYRVWSSMKSRCINPRHASYADYGGRGIYVCERWVGSFSDFLSDMGLRPFADAQLERVDNSGPYSPENCVWASRKTQARNRRNTVLFEVDGRRITIAEMSEMSGLGYQTIRKRLDAGWSADQAVKTPLMSFKEAGIKSARRFLARPA